MECLEPRRLLAAAYPSALEQYFVELINRARANPAGEAARTGYDLNEGLPAGTISSSPKQPLAINPYLTDAARRHSQWMIDADVFSHDGPGAIGPEQRMAEAGYVFSGNWTWGENLGWRGNTGSIDATLTTSQIHDNLYTDEDIPGRGHRLSMMNENFREVGPGVVTGVMTSGFNGYNAVVASVDFAKSGSGVYLTGVAYTDGVANDNFYTVGEGLGGVTVTATRAGDGATFSTGTFESGGYTLAVDAGTYTVTASGGELGGTIVYGDVVVADANVKRDFAADQVQFASAVDGVLSIFGTADHDTIDLSISGSNLIASRNGVDAAFSASAITSILVQAYAGDDYVTIGPGVIGTYVSAGEGADYLIGGNGNDTLTAGAGKDKVFGGEGDDRLNGNGGHDKVYGEAGRDRVYGGLGDDTLEGGAHNDRLWGDGGTDTMYGGGQSDIFSSSDDTIDHLFGASGTDTAYADLTDVLESIEFVG
jgi:Ca2+-binding RTX toxin-like protein